MSAVQGKRVFLSGPITGLPDGNRAAFEEAELAIRKAGAVHVYNPRRALEHGGAAGQPHSWFMLRTLGELTSPKSTRNGTGSFYDMAVMLDGWRASEGASLEQEVARACGIPVRELRELVTPPLEVSADGKA